MASMPGVLTDWPWKPLGVYKYAVLAPWVIHSTYSFFAKDKSERDLSSFLIFPFLLMRMIHNQIWITLSRYQTATGSKRILDKSLDFDQVDREGDWDDQILFNGILYYMANSSLKGASHLPFWRLDGIVILALLHAGPVEFLYYWLHRALHHRYLYSRYHSHHHSSIVTEPITSVIHPFAEHVAYFLLFSIPLLTITFARKGSLAAVLGYVTYIDFMNNMGHCNFELVPPCFFSLFPPLKYLMYTPSFHALHHTQFRTNYSLFMPLYDYIYGTMDKSSDQLYESSRKREEEFPDVIHLTHLTTPESIYHLRIGFASLASEPQSSKWYLWFMWPVTMWSMLITWIYGRTFVVERNRFDKLRLQTWAIPKYSVQYSMQWQKESINSLIEKAILDAHKKGAKVVSLGLMNQGEDLNRYGSIYTEKHPVLQAKVVDGSALAVAVVLNNIPQGTLQVLLTGKLTKVSCAIAFTLCRRGIQVATLNEDDYRTLKMSLTTNLEANLVLSRSYSHMTWLVGDEFSETEQLKAPKGTRFIPYSQCPPKKYRRDCVYYITPAMLIPKSLENVHSCENWLPRRVMSAWRVAGIIHALEEWNYHECGSTMLDIHRVWQATRRHGFQPMTLSTTASQQLIEYK